MPFFFFFSVYMKGGVGHASELERIRIETGSQLFIEIGLFKGSVYLRYLQLKLKHLPKHIEPAITHKSD